MARYGREIDNVRASLDWSFSSVGDVAIGVVLTVAYAPVWLDLSLVAECRERIERALNCLESDSNVNPSLTVQLHLSLVATLLDTMGSVERIKTVLAKALSAAERLGEVGATLQSLFALCLLYQHSGECREAQSTAERFERLALQIGDPALAPIAYRLSGNALHYGGKQREAQRFFERMLDAYTAPNHQRHTIWSSFDLCLLGQAALARVLWPRGFVDQGVSRAQASFEEAQAMHHKPTLCWVIHYGAFPFALIMRDFVAAGRAMAMLRDAATSPREPFWTTLAHCMEGKLLIRRGEFGSGSALLRAASDTCERTGWTICYPEFLGALAEGLAGLGQFTEAIATLAAAVRGCQRVFGFSFPQCWTRRSFGDCGASIVLKYFQPVILLSLPARQPRMDTSSSTASSVANLAATCGAFRRAVASV
jgi:hypothetical protein